MPFARQLLIRGTKVIFCANQEPSINDITVNELEAVVKRCCQHCTIIQKAYNLEQLLVFCSGQTSVCLDLRNITSGALLKITHLLMRLRLRPQLIMFIVFHRTLECHRCTSSGSSDYRGNGPCLTHQFICQIQM